MTVAPLIAMKSTKFESLEAVGKELELSRSLMASEERLDALRWQLRTSPESSGRGARG